MASPPVSSFSSKPTPYPECDALLFKFQGPTSSSLAESTSKTCQIIERHGGVGFCLAWDENEADMLWSDRNLKNAHCTMPHAYCKSRWRRT
ncbi:hypothetical protein CPC08DRAFT_318166 [Agrocybe pediades]|nr:hypothetical protein CPC08DRAFT_318166 [Agrocybe pediades]